MKKDQLTIQSPTPATLIEMAISKGVDTVQLKELMDLQERWEMKEAKKSFFQALAKFQNTVPVLNKKKTANIQGRDGKPGFSYRYADLATISQGIKKPLSDCGLSYRWEFSEDKGMMKATCLLTHKDGHTETTSMEAGKDASGAKNDIQQRGSTQTYLQRYTLIGALGLSTADEDNDGKSSNKKQTVPETKELSRGEILDQWKSSVKEVKTKIALQALYLKNQKTVDSDTDIQAIFKAKQDELKGVNPQTPALP